jgi:uncharacterized protein (DUF1810 family)
MERFLIAQNGRTPAGNSILEQSIQEISNGYLSVHCYIRYLFPQMLGLGTSAVTNHFGVRGREKALAFMQDEELRTRYLRCCQAIVDSGKSIYEIFRHNTMRIRASLLLMNSVYDDPLIKKLLKQHC